MNGITPLPLSVFTFVVKYNVIAMAKYSKAAQEKVGKKMHEFREGTLKSGSGKKVKSRKQAVAIGLSEAREEGKKVPKKKAK